MKVLKAHFKIGINVQLPSKSYNFKVSLKLPGLVPELCRYLTPFSGGQLSIDRNQISEITNRKIVVLDPLKGVRDRVPAPAPAV